MTPKTPLSLSLFPSLVYHMQLGSRVAVMLAEVEAMILRSSMASIKDAPRGTGVLQCHSCGLPHIESSGGGGLFSTSPPLLCEMVEYLNAVCLNYGGYNFPPHTHIWPVYSGRGIDVCYLEHGSSVRAQGGRRRL
jgi:hypothetical protein